MRYFNGLVCATVMAAIGIWASQASAEDFQLKNDRVRFQVSEATGALSGGWCETTNEKCLASGKDHYILETEKETRRSDETKDALIVASDGVKTTNGAQELVLSCRNTDLGLSIVKKYRLEPDADRIYKEVTFDGPAGQLLTYRCEAVLDAGFRKGGYYHRLSHSWRSSTPLYEAKYVTGDVSVDVANLLQATFINLQKGCGLGFYRDAVNGHALFFSSGMAFYGHSRFSEEGKIVYTSNGWVIPLFQDFLREGYRPVVQSALTIFKGDQVTFHREYQQLMKPLLDEIDCSASSPEWVRHIKADLPFGTTKDLELALKLIAKLNRGYAGYVPVIIWKFERYGDWYGNDEAVKELADDKAFLKPSFIAELVKTFRAASPWIKCSVYTNSALVEKDTLLYKHHPDWVIHEKDGQPAVALAFGHTDRVNGRGYWRELKGPGAAAWLQQLKDLAIGLNLDYQYMDFTLAEGSVPDWGSKVCMQDYEGYDLARKLLEMQRDRGGAVHYNVPFPGFSDIGYWEAAWESLYEDDWRVIADRLSFVKLYQRNHRPIVICAGLLAGREAQRTLVNYWLAMGFCPSNIGRQMDRVPLELAPYINAAYELKNTELVDADVQPCFLTDRKTEIEAHTLQQGSARLIAVINHGPKKASVTVSADREKMGLKADRRTMSWLIAPQDATRVDFSKVTWDSPIDHLVDNTLLRVEEKLEDRVKYTLDLEPEIVRIILISQSPALVYSINGERMQCLLPDAGGADVSLKGVFGEEQRNCRVNVKTTQKEAEILILYPKNWEIRQGGLRVEAHDGANVIQKDMPYEVVTLDGERFLKVKAKGWDIPYDIHVE